MKVDLSKFNPGKNFDRGASSFKMAAWYLAKMAFFLSAIPWPYRMKSVILRIFGAEIGEGAVIKPRVNIHLPWKLSIGDYCWIGEEVLILNFEKVRIGSHSCISQRAFLCAGNHDYQDEHMAYRHAPIEIGAGVWVGAQSFIGPGVTLEDECVVTAGSIAIKNLPKASICSGNPAEPKKPRWV